MPDSTPNKDNVDLSPDVVQARLAAIVASSDDAIISKDLDGIIRSWNGAAERIFGYTADEIVGRSMAVLIPADRPDEESQILERVKRGERVDHFQTVRVHKDGRRILVAATVSPIRDAGGRVVGASQVARDLTAAAELEGMYAAIIANSDDAIVSKTLDGVVRSWNAGAERVFGYTAAEMIGRSITVLFPPDRMDEEPKILERLKRGERVDHFETVRVRKEGRHIDVSVTISPVKDPTGRVTGASKIARDITALKRFMVERERLLAGEQAARQEAERANRTKDEFLATISHELRTPLNAILGWAQVLRNAPASAEDTREAMEVIERNARLQTQLIDDLLDMSRVISGKLRLDVRPVDLPAVVGEAIDTVRPAADAKGIRIHRLIDPMACPITGDASRLQQVLWNLMTNAVKFTPKGGTVQVLLRRINSHVEVSVTDTGQGIAADFLPQLFDRFTQADASTTRRHGGLGLGLAIARHLVELHGGTIRAASPGAGQGSTFTVSLPVRAVHGDEDADDRAHPTAEQVNAGGPIPLMDLSGVKVLVVDDEPDARGLVKRVLTLNRALVTTAASAAEALEALRRDPPHVLLSDIGMPYEDGYQLLEKVRRLPAEQGGNTPAVALTAFARSEDRRRALMAGFQMHLPKPVEPGELVAVVSNLSGAMRRNVNPTPAP